MDHQEALRRSAVEKYLLNEMPGPERDEFEEHFFGCQECAADLRATAAFLDGAKQELRRSRQPKPDQRAPKKPWFDFLWRPAFAAPAAGRGISECRDPSAVRRRAGAAQESGNPDLALFGRGQQPGRARTVRDRRRGSTAPDISRYSNGGAILELRLRIGRPFRRRRVALAGVANPSEGHGGHPCSLRAFGAGGVSVDRTGACESRGGIRRSGKLSVHIERFQLI